MFSSCHELPFLAVRRPSSSPEHAWLRLRDACWLGRRGSGDAAREQMRGGHRTRTLRHAIGCCSPGQLVVLALAKAASPRPSLEAIAWGRPWHAGPPGPGSSERTPTPGEKKENNTGGRGLCLGLPTTYLKQGRGADDRRRPLSFGFVKFLRRASTGRLPRRIDMPNMKMT